jgi:glycosyltransferase involved in cell wall biosynthesis
VDYKYTFTVFTTSFNRAYVLHRAYESLKPQTFRDFEWLIADNGSSDNTQEIVKNWIKEADFPIRLISWEKNAGVNGGLNRGVAEAQGKFFLKLDSDDECVPNTLEDLKKYWDLIPEESKENFTGVTSQCSDQHGNMVCGNFPKDITDSDSLEMKYKYKVTGEMWGFNKTDIMKQHPFPETGTYTPLSLVWSKIARKYKTRFVNQVFRTWYHDEPGREDQMTFRGNIYSKIKEDSPGSAWIHLDILNNDIGWFRNSPKEFLRSAVHYSRFSLHSEVGLFDQVKKLNTGLAKFLWLAMLPVGVLVSLKDRR